MIRNRRGSDGYPQQAEMPKERNLTAHTFGVNTHGDNLTVMLKYYFDLDHPLVICTLQCSH
jgi:hypothetical protein